jgi:hypothetical protein
MITDLKEQIKQRLNSPTFTVSSEIKLTER